MTYRDLFHALARYAVSGQGPHTFTNCKYKVKDFPHGNPLFPCNRFPVLVVKINSVHELAVDVKLLMCCSAIADTDRVARTVSGEVARCVI